ncbi:hypothetical protein MZM54_01265 [[Brevibacterium] frigoritolerans]|nr:hypothetical protein [Peribacillus frigoritolerans]
MKIEVQNEQNNTATKSKRKKEKGDMFDVLFKQIVQSGKSVENKQFAAIGHSEEKKQSTGKGNILSISVKKLIELENQIKDPTDKKKLDELLSIFFRESNVSLKNKPIDLSELKKLILENGMDIELKIPTNDFKQLVDNLNKINNLDISLSKLVSEIDKTRDLLINGDGKSKEISLTTYMDEQELKPISIDKKEVKKQIDLEIKSGNDLFEQLKKHRLEVIPEIAPVQNNGSSWQIASVKKTQMKIEDWTNSFKQEIDRLADFRIENREKVSMLLKEENEQLRIVVEKRDSYIMIEASVTDNMREKLNNILAEVRNEMGEKGIEVRVEITQEQDDEEKEKQKENNNKNQSQGGGRNGREHN